MGRNGGAMGCFRTHINKVFVEFMNKHASKVEIAEDSAMDLVFIVVKMGVSILERLKVVLNMVFVSIISGNYALFTWFIYTYIHTYIHTYTVACPQWGQWGRSPP